MPRSAIGSRTEIIDRRFIITPDPEHGTFRNRQLISHTFPSLLFPPPSPFLPSLCTVPVSLPFPSSSPAAALARSPPARCPPLVDGDGVRRRGRAIHVPFRIRPPSEHRKPHRTYHDPPRNTNVNQSQSQNQHLPTSTSSFSLIFLDFLERKNCELTAFDLQCQQAKRACDRQRPCRACSDRKTADKCKYATDATEPV